MMKSSGGGGGGSEDSSGSSGVGETAAAVKKGPWTAAEDAILVEYVKKHGEGNWNAVQKNSGLSRCGKSCRLRWANHLRPNLKKGSFSPEEELLILQLHAQIGNKWARMAAQLPGRTDNEIKNYWNTRIKRRQRAGLPLYPPEIQRQASILRPPPITVPSTPSTPPSSSPLSRFDHSPFPSPTGVATMLLLAPNSYANPISELPRVKRLRDDGLTFQFPLSPVSPHTPRPTETMFHNNLGNFELSSLSSSSPSPYSVKMELPSTQLFNEQVGDGGGGLLDALLQEAQGMGNPPAGDKEDFKWAQLGCGEEEEINGGGGGKDLFMESVSKLGNSDCFIGINMKRERPEEMNPVVNDDISKLLDMIPTPSMPVVPEWYNSDSGEMSNGGQSSVMTDDEIGLEMQQLASSLSIAPVDPEWNIGSCPWNNMPGIC